MISETDGQMRLSMEEGSMDGCNCGGMDGCISGWVSGWMDAILEGCDSALTQRLVGTCSALSHITL